MKQILLQIALAATMLTIGPAAASEQDDVMKIVRQWVDSLNKGDTKTAIAARAPGELVSDQLFAATRRSSGSVAWVMGTK